jgi:anaerobic ribonucleoside-triphosphate reductase activating protein
MKYKAFEIYISGCNGTCDGCFNPELKDFQFGKQFNTEVIESLLLKITEFNSIIENIWILGGDPLDQEQFDLIQLLSILKKNTNKSLWLWTRYDLNNISMNIKQYCDYIKVGAYIPNFSADNNVHYGVKLQTSNQKIFKKGTDY